MQSTNGIKREEKKGREELTRRCTQVLRMLAQERTEIDSGSENRVHIQARKRVEQRRETEGGKAGEKWQTIGEGRKDEGALGEHAW